MTSAASPRRQVIVLALCAALTSVVAGQTPVQDLAKPPATARHFIIQSTGGRHGESWMWDAPDGVRMGRESMNLRGQVFELDSSGKAGPEKLTTLQVGAGATERTITLWSVTGISTSPLPIWSDADNHFFAVSF